METPSEVKPKRRPYRDRREYSRSWYADNKDKARQAMREWAAKNQESVREAKKRYREANLEKVRASQRNCRFKRKYGITADARDAMLVAQDNRCGACRSSDPKSVMGWHLDHCHKTGEVRGLLCQPCNHALGNVEDSVERLSSLIDYLGRY